MKYALGNLLFAGVLALSFGAARADVLTLNSSSLKDNDQLAVKNACADKQRSPNCVGENVSPPLAWSGAPEGTKSFAMVMLDPEGRAPAGVVHMVIYGIPGDVKGFAEGELILLRHRIGVAWVVLCGALQHGHRARVVARATMRCRRIVAIEFSTCRGGRMG